jgi:putative oxidoreductase
MIWGHLSQYRNLGLLVLRASVGLYMAFGHGLGKITGGPEQWAQLGGVMEGIFGFVVAPMAWGFLAAAAEFVGALFVTVGLLTRPAALVLVLNMTVAALAHITGVIEGSPESALIYGFVFLSLVLVGPGAYSVDGDA